MKRFALTLALFLLATLHAAGPVSYDIAYVRAPRFGDTTPSKFQDVVNATKLDPGCDLMRRRADGTEDVLVPGGTGCVADPWVSFDGATIYYTYYPDLRESAMVDSYSGHLPKLGADIWKVDVATKTTTQLTHGMADYDPAAGGALAGYGIVNAQPTEVQTPFGPKLIFVSNRAGYQPVKALTALNLQLYAMDLDGDNVTAIDPMSLSAVMHPFALKDGSFMFSSAETQGIRDSRLWGIWSMWPDGRQWGPILSAFANEIAFHFATQLSNGDVVVTGYYNANNFGFGALYRLPLHQPAPAFGSPDPTLNAPLAITLDSGLPWTDRFSFEPKGLAIITPWTHPIDRNAPAGQGKLTMPSGAPNGDCLVVGAPSPVHSGSSPAPDAGIYLIPGCAVTSAFSALQLVVNNPAYNELWPRALVPYRAIYGQATPNALPWLPNDGTAAQSLPAGTPYGIVGTASVLNRNSAPGKGLDSFNADTNGCANLFCQGGDVGVYSDADIWAMRIVGLEPSPDYNQGPQPFYNHFGERMVILGEIPLRKVNADGSPVLDGDGKPDTSFLAKVPADTPFTFQLIDKEGRALVVSQTWHQVRPGEVRNDCGGCHAHANLPSDFSKTAAAKPDYVPVDLTHPVASHFEFAKDIRPILAARCVSCHSGSAPAGSLRLDDQTLVSGLPYTPFPLPKDYSVLAWNPSPAYRYPNGSKYVRTGQSRRSFLLWVLAGQRLDGLTNASATDDLDWPGTHPPTGVTAAEIRTVAAWIDTGACLNHPNGCTTDTERPTLAVSHPRQGESLSTIALSAADADAGVDWTSVQVTADVAVTGLTPLPAPNAEGIIRLAATSLVPGHLTAKVKDKAGNQTTVKVSFAASPPPPSPPPPVPSPPPPPPPPAPGMPTPTGLRVMPGHTFTLDGTSYVQPVELQWNAVAGAVTYELQVFNASSGTSVWGNPGPLIRLIGTGFYLPKAMQAGNYTWTIRACGVTVSGVPIAPDATHCANGATASSWVSGTFSR